MQEQKSNKEQISESYKLTPKEKKEVIARAIKIAEDKKAARLRTKEYWQCINEGEKKLPLLITEDFRTFVLGKANQMIPDFELDEYRRPVFDLLCRYFSNDKDFETGEYSLKKGILLFGNVGCGKTTMMEIFKANQKNSYVVISARSIAAKYMEFGFDGIGQYNELIQAFPNEFKINEYGLCIDDLGTESDKKHFGNNINVIQEILLNRYDKLSLNGKTFITTNLTGEDIEKEYGLRLRSRMREMFNTITFDTKSSDLRI